jgi:ATP-binding cassette subfamily F protein 1
MASIKCPNINLQVTGKTLLLDTDLIINKGSKYALIGYNGTGKTSLLKEIQKKNWGIPLNTDIFYVEQEVEADPNITVVDMVIQANKERSLLMTHYNSLKNIIENSESSYSDEDYEKYQQLIEDLRLIGAFKDDALVREVLHGLGFIGRKQQDRPTSEFSGGWRMRISIARALYLKPKYLLLDEPTNHLDLNSTIWLTSYLSDQWKNTLLVVSHDKNFINNVCNNIIHLYQKKLVYYVGNYDQYEKTIKQNTIHQIKEWTKIEKRVNEMKKKGVPKKVISTFLELDKNKQFKPCKPYRVRIPFEEVGHLKSPVIAIKNLTFGYDAEHVLFENITRTINMDTRVAIVGKNGVGKTTLLKNILKQIDPSETHIKKGDVCMDKVVRIGYFHQHSTEILPSDMNPVNYLLSLGGFNGIQDVRRYLGRIGLETGLHNSCMEFFSGGQKARVVFASLCICKPHILFLDEPTNNLDIESRDALIEGIVNFDGGVVMITHDIQLIKNTNASLWELENKNINETCYEEYEKKVLKNLY